jgi:hypothetical protein
MEPIKGGFALNDADERILNQQRSITAQVNNNFIQVGAIFLQMSGKNPFASDWYKRKFRDTNLQNWIDSPECRDLNLGFNLQFGWLDVDIDAEDPRYNQCIIKAFKFIGIDTRFAFGRLSKQVPSHVMVQLDEIDAANYDTMKGFEPKQFKIGGKRFKSELRSMGPIQDDKPNAIKESRQTVMPGSIYTHKTDPGKYDISVWYAPDGKTAIHVGEVAATTPRKVSFSSLITGIAFGTFLYILQPFWIEGTRQQLAIKVAGWLARLVRESQGINDNDGISRGTYCPIGTPEVAESMIDFLCGELGDHESHMRKRVFRDAIKKLDNNPDARIPGWPALEGEIGAEALLALRTVFMPGVDVSPLTKMADRYIYDETDDKYIDRDRFYTMAGFIHDGAELDRRHRNDFIEVAGKMKPVFKLFESSPLRRRVGGRDLYPDFQPGSIFRISRAGDTIPDDQDGEPGTMTMFNTWRGWPILPAKNPDQALIDKCNAMMDQLFEYLSQGNKEQIKWLKEWIAWTVQNPGQKQQVAPVFVGGQGVGKSFFGNIFLGQLFQNQWGSASPKILEGTFSVEPFINKMFVFIDEAKFHSESATDEIKKLIRSDRMGGAEKFQSARTYRIFARVVFASNRFDMNIGQQNMQDRALFYLKTYDKDYLNLTDGQFKEWTVKLKPFFDEFNTFIYRMDVKEHFMYIFNTMKVNRHDLEDTALSSGSDKHIVESNMSYARRIAKAIIEEGRIWEDLDISAPFTMVEFNKRVSDTCDSMRIRFVQPRHVFEEFTSAGLIEPWASGTNKYWRFKYRIGTLTQLFGTALGVELESRFIFEPDDFGPNQSEFIGAKPWKGSINSRFRNGI